ncbi:MAG: CD1871A family CXXC motif-containing protein [Schwartzia sp. (in: firmicutes)]
MFLVIIKSSVAERAEATLVYALIIARLPRSRKSSPLNAPRCRITHGVSLCSAPYPSAKAKGVLMKKTLWLLGIGLVAFGLHRGEGRQVLSKAVRICLECIGIG